MRRTKTGEGYVYYRCRACGTDETVYEHQLVALLDYAGEDVFDDENHVHHEIPVPELNTRRNLRLLHVDEHEDVDEHVENITREPVGADD